MFDKGSTAVLSTPNLPFIVAVKQAGIFPLRMETGSFSMG